MSRDLNADLISFFLFFFFFSIFQSLWLELTSFTHLSLCVLVWLLVAQLLIRS
ncbi:uncharacterized protein B0P05DRAFT_539201 [Gilbertella persicaria]|uniref:uncharacterized protein n=1 Tax=Gilbertella persicaria TaxID=101096 RepID=UPI00221E7871|nr:uncharacterized protein B0P05DRAFT_539201 [Gilbertella persicaria]KAI8080696.1 hypothetical protein B0P05DRAFT_539201 [Gilbertella persicaria]